MFRFRLERVLQHRQRRLDACTREAALAADALASAQAALAAARQDLATSREETAARRRGSLQAEELTRQLAWHEILDARVRHLEPTLAAAMLAQAAAQERLQAAWRDREVLQRLKARRHGEWLRENERRERRTLDEVGAIRAALARHEAAAPGVSSSHADRSRSAEGDRP